MKALSEIWNCSYVYSTYLILSIARWTYILLFSTTILKSDVFCNVLHNVCAHVEMSTLTGSLNLPAMHFTSPVESSPSGQVSMQKYFRERSRQAFSKWWSKGICVLQSGPYQTITTSGKNLVT